MNYFDFIFFPHLNLFYVNLVVHWKTGDIFVFWQIFVILQIIFSEKKILSQILLFFYLKGIKQENWKKSPKIAQSPTIVTSIPS
jgi:hypothetical protein